MEEEVKTNETEKTNKLIDAIIAHPKATFWFRFVMWTLFAAVLPFVYIAYRFDLFKKMSEFSISGWGIFAVLIIAIFVISLLKYIRLAFKGKYSLAGQCFSGIIKIIVPLVALYVILNAVKTNLDVFMEALGCVTISELIAIPLNPMPEFVDKKQKDIEYDKRKDTVDYFLDSFFSKKEKSDLKNGGK